MDLHGVSAQGEGLGRKWLYLLWALVLISFAFYFTRLLIYTNHNEDMYLAASYFVARGLLPYRDFGFLQTPLLPLLYGLLHWLTGISLYFLGKTLSLLAYIAGAVVVVLTAYRYLPKKELIPLWLLLYQANLVISEISLETSNYIIPFSLGLTSLYLFLRGMDQEGRFLYPLLSGLLMGIATGFKLYYAPFIGMLGILVMVLYPAGTRVRAVAGFTLGALVGLLPLLYFLVAYPKRFLFFNITYHQLNTEFRRITGYKRTMHLAGKLGFAIRHLYRGDNFLLLVLGIFPVVWRVKDVTWYKWMAASILTLSALLIALYPTPSFDQYYALVAGFLLIAAILSLAMNEGLIRITTLAVVPSLVFSAGLFYKASTPSLSYLRLRRIADQATRLLTHCPDHKVLTLSNRVAVEIDGVELAPQLASGSFLFRISSLVSPGVRKDYGFVGPVDLETFAGRFKPSLVITGIERLTLDRHVQTWARSHGYKRVTEHLWVSPACRIPKNSDWREGLDRGESPVVVR